MYLTKQSFYLYFLDYYNISLFNIIFLLLGLSCFSRIWWFNENFPAKQILCPLDLFLSNLDQLSLFCHLILRVLNDAISHSVLPFLLSFISQEIFRCFIVNWPLKTHQERAQGTNMDEFNTFTGTSVL